jgi:hypothetical protein
MTDQRKPMSPNPEVSKKAPQSAQPELRQRELAQEAQRKSAQAQHSAEDAQNRIHSRNRVSDKDADNPNSRKH